MVFVILKDVQNIRLSVHLWDQKKFFLLHNELYFSAYICRPEIGVINLEKKATREY